MPKRARDYETRLLERLRSPDYATRYLNAVLAEESPDAGGDFLAALRLVAKARDITITDLAEQAGLGRQALYRSLSHEGNPEFATLGSVLRELGLRLAVEKTG